MLKSWLRTLCGSASERTIVPGEFIIEFTGLCLIHVTPGAKAGQQATAYALNIEDHEMARLVFPLDALATDPWPEGLPPARVIDAPQQPLLISMKVNGYRVSFDKLATEGVVATQAAFWKPPVEERDDLDYALDLKHLSGQTSLMSADLEAKANAVVELPAGRLRAGKPVDWKMVQQKWCVYDATGKQRVQGISDRIQHVFRNTAGGGRITMRFTKLRDRRQETAASADESLTLDLSELLGVRMGLSSLCAYRERMFGMPDVAHYNDIIPGGKIVPPEECDGAETPNASRCPPGSFIQK